MRIKLAVIMSVLLMAVGCGNNGSRQQKAAEEEAAADSLQTQETMETIAAMPEEPVFDIVTSLGTIRIRLYSDTPKHRDNFVKLATSGF